MKPWVLKPRTSPPHPRVMSQKPKSSCQSTILHTFYFVENAPTPPPTPRCQRGRPLSQASVGGPSVKLCILSVTDCEERCLFGMCCEKHESDRLFGWVIDWSMVCCVLMIGIVIEPRACRRQWKGSVACDVSRPQPIRVVTGGRGEEERQTHRQVDRGHQLHCVSSF